MKTIDELGISKTPWERTDNHPRIVWNGENIPLVTGIKPADAHLISAAPELLAFSVAYYEANKKNDVKINPNNGDKFQSGLMLMCKKALVKAGIMDKSEVWQEE